MGLDAWLYAEVYISGYAHRIDPRFAPLADVVGITPTADAPSFHVKATVAYWRKANQIHGWFVDNVQKGVDECQTTWLERSKLVELRDLCQEVKDNPDEAAELLPSRSGFFFGGEEYDDWYYEQVYDTIDTLTEILATFPEGSGTDFYYQSSW